MKSLNYFFLKNNGRNNTGKITVRHKGGGQKRLYRLINFSYNQLDVSRKIVSLEYNPNKTSKILLTKNSKGFFEYYISSQQLNFKADYITGPNFRNFCGLSKPLWNIPLGTNIHNVELQPKKGAQIARASGSFCTLIGLHKSFAIIKLPSKEFRLIKNACFATIGHVLNNLNNLISDKKAGKNRWRGIRPFVRGVAMNPIDHPHGGGEGRCPVGHPAQLSPWGKPTSGLKTRRVPNKFFLYKKK